MSVEIKDFRKLPEPDKTDAIYQALDSIASSLKYMPDGKLPIGTILPFARNKEMRFPDGYELCNGQNKVPDLRQDFTDAIVYIQRVK